MPSLNRSSRLPAFLPAALLVIAALLAPLGPSRAADTGLTVAQITVCRDVDRAARTAVAPGDTFPADVGRLFCLTRVTGAADTTAVVHVWVHDGKPRARVRLPVRSPDWRTWSSKRILPAWTGPWEVMVLDAAGVVLERRAFQVVPAPAAATEEDTP